MRSIKKYFIIKLKYNCDIALTELTLENLFKVCF